MKNSKKFALTIAFLIIIYIVVIIFLCRTIGSDSDKANHLLQAKDIMTGNIFLSGWNMTGITFLTTDLIFYDIAFLLFGVSYRAIYVAAGLMIATTLVAICILTVSGKEKKKVLAISIFFLALIPCKNFLGIARVHTGAVLLCIVSFIICHLVIDSQSITKKGLKRLALANFIVIMLGTIGDLLVVIEGVIPIFIVCFFHLLYLEKKENMKKYIYLFSSTASAVLIGKIFDKLFYMLGKANSNNYIANRAFSAVDEWSGKWWRLFNELLSISAANFGSEKMGNIWTLMKGVNFIIVLFSFFVLIKVIFSLVKGKKADTISSLISCAIIMSSAAFIFTSISEIRYATIIPLGGAVLVVRCFDDIFLKVNNKKLLFVSVCCTLLIIFIGRIHETTIYKYPSNIVRNKKLISFLKDHNLKYGYASFWNASNLTVLSKEDIKIRHIMKVEGEKVIDKFVWFNKDEWYEEPANFILINNRGNDEGVGDPFGISKENIVRKYGEPSNIYECEQYLILVYDKTITINNKQGLKGN